MSVDYKKVISVAKEEVGYLEKASNKQLDSKIANPGKANFTKYGKYYDEVMGTHLNGQSWCAMFVCYCFCKAYGIDAAKKLLGGNLFAYTPAGAKMTKAKKTNKPQKGGLVFFYHPSLGRIGHIGLVYDYDDTYFYTIEGNTSTTFGVVRNGGCVAKKRYSRKMSTAYFARLPFTKTKAASTIVVKKETPKKPANNKLSNNNAKNPYKLKATLIKKGDTGASVKWVQWELNQWKSSLTIDGIFGDNTVSEVKKFQKQYKLTVDGIVGKNTIIAFKAH